MTESFQKVNKAFLHCNNFSHRILSTLMNWHPLFPFFLYFRPARHNRKSRGSSMWPWSIPNTRCGRGRRPNGSGGVSPPSWGPKSFGGRRTRSKHRSRQSSTGPWSACPANCRPSCSPRTTMSTTNEPAASPLHRQEFGGRKKRLGDYSFVSDVISVAVLSDLPCPVRAHQSLPLLSSTTSWPSGPFLLPPSNPPTHPPPAHKHAFTFFLSEVFRSLSFSHWHKRHKHKWWTKS